MPSTCPKCFHALDDGAVTCGNCGARIRPQPKTPPPVPPPLGAGQGHSKTGAAESVTQARPATPGESGGVSGAGPTSRGSTSGATAPPATGASPPEARPIEAEYGRARASVGGGGESVMLTLISAALFLYVGFGVSLVGVSQSAFYNNSVTAFTWGARVVGIALLVVAGLSFTGMAFAVVVDAIVAVVAALGCLIIGGIWVAYGVTSGWLVLLFGLLNASAARGAISRLLRRLRRVGVRD